MEYFIGLDAHSKSCTLVTLNEKGEEKLQRKIPTCESHLLAYVRSHKNAKLNLVFEETNLSQWLYLTLKSEVQNLVSCNAGYLGKKVGAKNDYADAKHLANELRCGHVVPVYHEDSEIWTMKTMVQGYLDFNHQIIQTKNRYKALLRSNNIDTKGNGVYKDDSMIDKLPTAADQFVARTFFDHLQTLEKLKASYLPEFERYASRNKIIKTLCSVPGISLIRASIVSSIICSPHRFPNKHKLWAYSMLVKHTEESDDRVYGKKTIQGRRELKCVFDGAAVTTLAGNSYFRRYYDQLRSKGKSHRDARKDVARKIASTCLSILKNGKKFDDKYEEKLERREKKLH